MSSRQLMSDREKKLEITKSARRDLRDIHRYIRQDDPRAAAEFVGDLTAKLMWIADTGFSGSPRDHIRPGLRGFPYRSRCIYFRSYEDRVVIVRILHGAQDVARQRFDE